MGLKCGIVGLPNAGKSTLFNALVNSHQAETGNYPFCTLESNKGQVLVPDDRLKKISAIIKPKQIIPAVFEFIDIAGLIKGASLGEGLGNQFLSHIRSVDSLLHLVRSFKDKQITHVYGEPDPLRDIEIINTELLLSDLEIAEKRFQKIHKIAQSAKDKKLMQERDILKKVLDILSKSQSLREFNWSKEEKACLKPLNFISLKPILYILNFKEEDFLAEAKRSFKNKSGLLREPKGKQEESFIQKTIQNIKNSLGQNTEIMALSCSLEEDMLGWTEKEKAEFLNPLGLKASALKTVIQKVYKQLNLISFFTAGEKEVKAWTIPQGALAPQAGAVIHSDFEKGFIRAEVYHCEDLFKHSSEKSLKEKGLLKKAGKDYLVRDGDALHFLFKV